MADSKKNYMYNCDLVSERVNKQEWFGGSSPLCLLAQQLVWTIFSNMFKFLKLLFFTFLDTNVYKKDKFLLG